MTETSPDKSPVPPGENPPGPRPSEEALTSLRVQTSRVRRIQRLAMIYGALFLVAGGVVFRSFPVVLGIFLGALIMVADFFWLTRLVRQAFLSGTRPSKGFFLKFGLKFVFLLAIVALVIFFTPVNPVAFLVGLSVSVLGILTDGIIGVFKME